MKPQKTVRVLGYLIVLACLGVVARAQSSQRIDPVAAVTSDRAEVKWQPQIEYGRMVLTVSGPDGAVFRKEFDSAVSPSFKLTDDKGFNLPDGQYTYELRVIPAISHEVKKALAASRESANTAEVIRELQNSGRLPKTTTVQSGFFSIENGVAFTGSEIEPTEPPRNGSGGDANQLQSKKKKGGGAVTIQDVVTADDAIIQGSLCVGLDCVNNESFGFDTIRLKENNTRIKFDDTSTAAGFPANDWQLTANDSASGGANKFSIEDVTGAKVPFTITAGAPTNSLFVSSAGKVGLRTSTPVLDLHITSGDTPAHRLEQTAASGFTAQTWDIAGNEANFFVRDVTGGSRLPFRIRPGAPTSSIDISASGKVGVGTASPQKPLHVVSPDATNGIAVGKNDSLNLLLIGYDNTNNRGAIGSFAAGVGSTLSLNALGGNVGIGTVTPAGKLDVNGSIFQRGIQLFADYVFEPTYELETIEEHADYMWNNRHLPAVGAKQVDEQGREFVEIGSRLRGLLEELEKAHVYISMLNNRATEKDEQLAKLERQNAELAERLSRLEALMSASKAGQK